VPFVLQYHVHGTQTVEAADLDGDGDEDLLAPGGLTPSIYFQTVDGRFDQEAGPTGSQWASIGDLDGDGDPDIVTSSGIFWGGE
jgi:hypothetical protein